MTAAAIAFAGSVSRKPFTKRGEFGDPSVYCGELRVQQPLEFRQKLTAKTALGGRHQLADLFKREAKRLRLAHEEQPALVLGAVETVTGVAALPRPNETNSVVVADGAAWQPDPVGNLFDGTHAWIVVLSRGCQVKQRMLPANSAESAAGASVQRSLRRRWQPRDEREAAFWPSGGALKPATGLIAERPGLT